MIWKVVYLTVILYQVLQINCYPQGSILLGYKPIRPSYHPNPGNNIQQIIPPGEPWPARPQDYEQFSQTTKPPWFTTRSTTTQLPLTRTTSTTTLRPTKRTQSATDSLNLLSINLTTNLKDVSSTELVTTEETQITTVTTENIGITTTTIESGDDDERNSQHTKEKTSTVLYTSNPLLENDTNSNLRNVSDLLPNRFKNVTLNATNNQSEAINNTLVTQEIASTLDNRIFESQTDNLENPKTTTTEIVTTKKEESINSEECNSNEESFGNLESIGSEEMAGFKIVVGSRKASSEEDKSDDTFEIVRAIEIINPNYDNIQHLIPVLIASNNQ